MSLLECFVVAVVVVLVFCFCLLFVKLDRADRELDEWGRCEYLGKFGEGKPDQNILYEIKNKQSNNKSPFA